MHLDINSDSYILYDGKTPEEIHQKHNDNQKSWNFNLFDTKKHKQLKINPFEDTCIGVYIESSNESGYITNLTETRKHLNLTIKLFFLCINIINNLYYLSGINVWRLTMMIIGIIIFWYAHILSRNSLFYYACGIIFGVTLSIILLTYMAGKLIPRVIILT